MQQNTVLVKDKRIHLKSNTWCALIVEGAVCFITGHIYLDSVLEIFKIGVFLTTCNLPTDATSNRLNVNHVCGHLLQRVSS